MPNGMPYHVEKAGDFQLLDSIGANPVKLQAIRQALVSGAKDLGDVIPVSALPAVPPPQLATEEHIREQWFGERLQVPGQPEGPSNPWVRQDPFNRWTNSTTGYWVGYYGHVKEILTELWIRAVEVALGIQHGAPPDATGQRPEPWTISAYWKCPVPWVEGWLSWRRLPDPAQQTTVPETAPDGAGIVNIFVCTPGIGKKMYTTPVLPQRQGEIGYDPDPDTDMAADNGLWVISEISHTKEFAPPWFRPRKKGDPDAPWHSWVGELPIVTVSPAEIDGGVRPGGLQA